MCKIYPMKVAGNGQGKILTPEELRRLLTEGLQAPRDRALFGICLFRPQGSEGVTKCH
jgi:hypothetical protein